MNAQAPPADGTDGKSWTIGSATLSGLIDGYYSHNFNHPGSRSNQLRNFDVEANQFSLNMAKLTLEQAPEPIGFRMDFGFGKTFDMLHAAERQPEVFRYLEQAYVALKPAAARGVQFDFGKFVTSAGAEVIETNANWNYSRSLLFAWAIPYYHFGARATVPLHKNFSAGVQLVNGWNNVEDNNSGKTVGLTGTITAGKVTWAHNYYFGPEKTDLNDGWRHLYDTTLYLNPHPRASMYLNFDYGIDKNPGFGKSRWVGVAGAARLAVTNWFAVSPRLEWFNDADGFSTGTVQKLKEFTMTGEFRTNQYFLTRLEYRRDWSDQPFFDRGATPGTFKNQDTLLVGIVAYFGPER